LHIFNGAEVSNNGGFCVFACELREAKWLFTWPE